MGNTCVTGKIAKNSLFYSLWSSSISQDMVVSNKDNKENKARLPSPRATQGPESILVQSSQLVKLKDEINRSLKPTKVEPLMIVKLEPKQVIMNHDIKVPKPDHVFMIITKSPQHAQPLIEKPMNFKRTMSIGLQVDSVLKNKTGHLKVHFNLGDKLGYGRYGTTFLCMERKTGKHYACKAIAKRKLLTVKDMDDVRREVEIMHHLSGHPNIISIKGAYEDSVAINVVMELCAGGELFDRIIKHGHYSEKKAAELTRTIVGVVGACHSLGVIHRDLKPENFLFVNEEEDSPLRAIDFGVSVFFKPAGEFFSDVVGSPYYVAPEVLNKRYGPEADVWSAGVIVYILLCGVPPFRGESEQEIFEAILHSNIDFCSDPWPKISRSAKDLVSKMLVRDPRKRITAHQVLCHPWLQIEGIASDMPLDSVLNRFTQFSAIDKLKKMALRVIAESLPEEEIAGLREMFKMIDTDNSGHITSEELKTGLKRLGANLSEPEIHDLMKAADVDNNGTIDYGEFIAATLHMNVIEKENHLLKAFSYFDKDGSGFITHDELQKSCQEFGIEDSHLEEIIKEADQNNDGRIEYYEFVAVMQKGNAMPVH